jgi:CxxC motif-containing protein (DUF1111 family)
MKRLNRWTSIWALTMSVVGCASANDSSEEASSSSLDAIGGHLTGISDADFAETKAAFVSVETVNDGVGPIFNEKACGNCHTQGAIGGAGTQIERRFGRFDNGIFNPLANKGGSLRQLFTLGNWTNSAGKACSVPLEVEPAEATVHNVGRLTTPLFGLGLVDAMPDSFFTSLANSEPSFVRGTVNFVNTILPNPNDPSQSIGSRRVGRFGWKAGVPNLVQFSADAYVNEMGITTQHCFKGTSITGFAGESAPNGVAVASGCDDNVPGLDEGAGSCANGRTAIQEDVDEFAEFMTFLAPPPRATGNATAIALGQIQFDLNGCANCHTRQVFTTPNPSPNGVPGGFNFQPYSDFLLHDMGSLGDQIGNSGDSQATTRMMRSAPLWGLRFRTAKLHDGRTTDITTAILAHSGQASTSVALFRVTSLLNRSNLLAFLNSL